MSLAKLRRRADRIRKQVEERKDRYDHIINSKDAHHPDFHKGWELGYYEGKLAEVEDSLDVLEANV